MVLIEFTKLETDSVIKNYDKVKSSPTGKLLPLNVSNIELMSNPEQYVKELIKVIL